MTNRTRSKPMLRGFRFVTRATAFPSLSPLKGLPTERLQRSRTLDDHRDRIATAQTEGRETALGAAVLHRVGERREDAGAAAANRMPAGPCPAVHVEFLVRNPAPAHHRDARRR